MIFTIPFSKKSSWPGDPSQIFCIAGRFFIFWATREVKWWTHPCNHHSGQDKSNFNPLEVLAPTTRCAVWPENSYSNKAVVHPPMEQFSAIKKEQILKHTTTWMNLQHIMISKRSQNPRASHSVIPFIWRSGKSKSIGQRTIVMLEGIWGGGWNVLYLNYGGGYVTICNYYVGWKWNCSVVSDSLQPHGLQPIRLLRPWDFPGKSAEVDCHFLLQGIVPTQESNPSLPHWRLTLLPSEPLSHQGRPLCRVVITILTSLSPESGFTCSWTSHEWNWCIQFWQMHIVA